MTGRRKLVFAYTSLACIVGGFGVSIWRGVSSELFGAYAEWLVWIVVAFGVPNGIEHIAGAIRARRGAPEVKP